MCEGPLFKYAHHRPRKLGTAAHHPTLPFVRVIAEVGFGASLRISLRLGDRQLGAESRKWSAGRRGRKRLSPSLPPTNHSAGNVRYPWVSRRCSKLYPSLSTPIDDRADI